MSAVAWWYEDDVDLDYGYEPCPTFWASVAQKVAAGIVSWSAAASVFDFDD